MNIRFGYPYPAGALSNLARHSFLMQGVPCASMEGLLQSLKTSDVNTQIELCTKTGHVARRAGAGIPWYDTQTLWWRGVEYSRTGDEYQTLLDEAYESLYTQSDSAKEALLTTKDVKLVHTVGKTKLCETILTRQEFCSRLMRIRRDLQVADLIS